MVMNKKEREHIEYHPKLSLSSSILAIVSDIEAEIENGYLLTDEIKAALMTPTFTVIDKGLYALQKIDELLDDIEERLAPLVVDGYTFDEYKRAKEDGTDHDIVRAWEEFHNDNMEGSLAGELYPKLLDGRKTIVNHMELLNDTVLGGKADWEDLQAIADKETNQMEQVIKRAKKNTSRPDYDPLYHTPLDDITTSRLQLKNSMNNIVSDAIDSVNVLANSGRSLMYQTVNDSFGGDVESVIEDLASALNYEFKGDGIFDDMIKDTEGSLYGSSNHSASYKGAAGSSSGTGGSSSSDSSPLNFVQATQELAFKQAAEESAEVSDRMYRITGEPLQKVLSDEFKILSKMRDDAIKALNWIDTIDTKGDTTPITETIEKELDSIDKVFDAYTDCLLDMTKRNEAERIQNGDFIELLVNKQKARDTKGMANAVSKFMPKDSDNPKSAAASLSNNMEYGKVKVSTATTQKSLTGGSLSRNSRM